MATISLPSAPKKGKLLMYALIVLILVLIMIAVYRYFFQFNNKLVKEYIKDESDKYANPKQVSELITDGVKHILSSSNLTKQVLLDAKNSGTEKEQELVYSAVMQCKLYNYLPS